jgi:DNA methylase
MEELRSVVAVLMQQYGHRPVRILDPMAGVGGVHQLRIPGDVATTGLEIEPEWAAQHRGTIEGDATDMPFGNESFEMIVTSPPYGNRMADQFVSKDGTERVTYYHYLGRRLHENSSAGMQFGPAYCKTMRDILVESKRVLVPDGVFVLNISDFIRAGEIVPVVQFYLDEMFRLQYKVIADKAIPTPRMRYGANHRVRVESERVIVFRKRT